eukprot:TRINITY_DN779945_c0_g1_i1.p1 TRINITY_DN779945_c0_g1~~TRINITY_DN779945_c0_g1_i1.p1  ORF type:complete len:385 (+),score=82.52 TRINITY_DN779945_c0_g1_i1:89-1243(+)
MNAFSNAKYEEAKLQMKVLARCKPSNEDVGSKLVAINDYESRVLQKIRTFGLRGGQETALLNDIQHLRTARKSCIETLQKHLDESKDTVKERDNEIKELKSQIDLIQSELEAQSSSAKSKLQNAVKIRQERFKKDFEELKDAHSTEIKSLVERYESETQRMRKDFEQQLHVRAVKNEDVMSALRKDHQQNLQNARGHMQREIEQKFLKREARIRAELTEKFRQETMEKVHKATVSRDEASRALAVSLLKTQKITSKATKISHHLKATKENSQIIEQQLEESNNRVAELEFEIQRMRHVHESFKKQTEQSMDKQMESMKSEVLEYYQKLVGGAKRSEDELVKKVTKLNENRKQRLNRLSGVMGDLQSRMGRLVNTETSTVMSDIY